jgi:hypothetical protein
MNIYIPQNTNSTPFIVGQMRVIDSDVNENFTITFNKLNFRALKPVTNPYSMVYDDGSMVFVRKCSIIRSFENSYIDVLGTNI